MKNHCEGAPTCNMKWGSFSTYEGRYWCGSSWRWIKKVKLPHLQSASTIQSSMRWVFELRSKGKTSNRGNLSSIFNEYCTLCMVPKDGYMGLKILQTYTYLYSKSGLNETFMTCRLFPSNVFNEGYMY